MPAMPTLGLGDGTPALECFWENEVVMGSSTSHTVTMNQGRG